MIYNDDCISRMKKFPDESIDMIFADPPYFLSNDGLSIHSGKVVSVNKGDWDKKENYQDTKKFTYDWLKECSRIMKNGASIWITGTFHNIFDIYEITKILNLKMINIIVWHKVDPPPLIYKTRFRYSYEFVLWASKGKNKTFNYDVIFKEHNEEMHDVWDIYAVQMNEKKCGYHPTQKPEALLDRIIKASTNVNDIVLDPFMGSGTTCVVAKKLKRKFIGIEKEKSFYELAKKRILSIN